MDAFDIFRKISRGCKFDKNRFYEDAVRFQLIKPKKPENTLLGNVKNGNEVTSEEIKQEYDEVKVKEEVKDNLSDNEDAGSAKKKKKKKIRSAKLIHDLKQEEINRFRNENRIYVSGTDVAKPFATFDELEKEYKLNSTLMKNIRSLNYTSPTPIQMQAIPLLLNKRELLACAPTGSGKTAAFLIPILHHLEGPRKCGFRAVVVSPTRELAKQTYQECCRLAEGLGFHIHLIEKSSSAAKKFGPNSSQKFDILITTPNRLVYLLKQEPPAINLKSVEWLIVDESDKLFEAGVQGFRDQLASIYNACDASNIRHAMFSATFAFDVENWCKENLDNVTTVSIGMRNSTTDLVEQELIFVGNEGGKLVAFRNLIKKGFKPPVLVFVQSKERASELFRELIYDGINVDVIHSERTQQQRDNVVKCFRMGSVWVLICTELMGRGIDFKGVNLVVNYDFPPSIISYIHRIGRTGRAGRAGKAITFFTNDDVTNLRSIAQVMRDSGCDVPQYMLELKKPKKEIKRKLARTAVKRKTISTTPLYDVEAKKKKMEMIEKSKKKKKMNSTSSEKEEKVNSTLSEKKKKLNSKKKKLNSTSSEKEEKMNSTSSEKKKKLNSRKKKKKLSSISSKT